VGCFFFAPLSLLIQCTLQDADLGRKVQTKVVCTIGPASWSYDGLMGLLKAGMVCARLNFSHGDHEGHQKVHIDTKKRV
jgi:pyruvate kinase